MLQEAEAPANHALHPHPKIQEQKLMDNAAVGSAASTKIRPWRNGVTVDGIGEIINCRNRSPRGGV